MSDPFNVSKRVIPAERLSMMGGKFGRIPRPPKKVGAGVSMGAAGGILGFYGGGTAGIVGSSARHRKEINANAEKIKGNAKQISQNSRKIRQAGEASLSKSAPVYRITDKGTLAGKYKLSDDTRWNPTKYPKGRIFSRGTKASMAVGAVAGAALMAGTGKRTVESQRKSLERQDKKLTKQTALLNKSATSAFGIDHG